MTGITIEAITPTIGANVYIAAEDVINEGMPARILQALGTYNVLVFPQIHLNDERFVALSSALGEKEEVKATADGSAPSDKGVYRISLDKDDKTQLEYVKGNDFWHMDGTSYKVPGKGTLLKCENPPSEGGDTGFANLFAAYDALPRPRKQQLEHLRVRHCLAAVGRKLYEQPTADDYARWDAVFPLTEHPLVWKQRDGRTSLLIGATADSIVGLPEAEGKAMLQELVDWCTQERFTYRHHWQKGDLVIFNNPGLLHRSYPYSNAAGRVMHRTTLKGCEAIE
jgi:alpha-ketoglutarate-dependent taurine dioxygenase